MRVEGRWSWLFGVGLLVAVAVTGAEDVGERRQVSRADDAGEAATALHQSPAKRYGDQERGVESDGRVAVVSNFYDLPPTPIPCFGCEIYELTVSVVAAAYGSCKSNLGSGLGRRDPRDACGTLWEDLQAARAALMDCEEQLKICQDLNKRKLDEYMGN